ncbi:MAG: glutamine-hydrolyzing GMP synthase [Candidatus Njordarchaeia archaeon]|nr:glutamine-hydrolyzing GMP synthase [Candidatus Korarchaeota archaeon]
MDKVFVINFGSQYTHLIARRIRELGVYSEIINYDSVERILTDDSVKAVILSGGPRSVDEIDAPKLERDFIEQLRERNIKILAICYSHQLIAYLFSSEILKGIEREFGATNFEVIRDTPLFSGMPSKFRVWMSHNDSVKEVPKGFIHIGRTENCKIAAMESIDGRIFTLQFHPEVGHTQYGTRIFENFLRISRVRKDWNLEKIIDEKVEEIKQKVNESKVLIAASGGVDSTVAAYLIWKAIGDNIYLVFIDTGLMRDGEVDEVVSNLRDLNFRNIIVINAKDEFLRALRGVNDPEKKRLIFSKVYVNILKKTFKELNKKVGGFRYLAQGTIYPDRIETGIAQKEADKIKSHHNVILAHTLGLEIIEPLKLFYKDEVRKIGKMLGISDRIIKRKPFPGPGLLIRILGEITEDKLRIIKKAHRIIEEAVKEEQFYDKLWQIFPVLLDSKSVGVIGDRRTYGYIIAIRAVISDDGMTAEFAKLPWDFLERIATKIVNEIKEVSRVVYDITNKPPATIEYE